MEVGAPFKECLVACLGDIQWAPHNGHVAFIELCWALTHTRRGTCHRRRQQPHRFMSACASHGTCSASMPCYQGILGAGVYDKHGPLPGTTGGGSDGRPDRLPLFHEAGSNAHTTQGPTIVSRTSVAAMTTSYGSWGPARGSKGLLPPMLVQTACPL